MAFKYYTTIQRGDTWRVTFHGIATSGDPVDFTGFSGSFTATNAQGLQIVLQTSDGSLVIDGSDIVVELDAEETAAIHVTPYRYELVVWTADQEKTICEGVIEVDP